MTINQFIDKWAPIEEPHLHLRTLFVQDFWSIIDKLGEDRFRQVAIEVLGGLHNTELNIVDVDKDSAEIQWGEKGKAAREGYIVRYSKAYGQHGNDWLFLLQCIATSSLRKLKTS